MTVDEAVDNAARILATVEVETNLDLMRALTGAADSWINIAALLSERERAT